MGDILNGDGNEGFIAFSGPATIPHVTDAWTRLSAAVAAGGDLLIDTSGVTGADLSFVQLIESARAACGLQGATVTLAQPADGALRDVLDRGGFLDGADAERLQFWTHAGAAQ